MTTSPPPEMSVLIVTPDTYQVIRRTIHHLRAQTMRNHLEIVIVAPSRQGLDLIESELAEFHSYTVVEVGEIRVLSNAKVTALTAARAPIVAFAEDHCFPEPHWAEALLAAHRQGYAAVGPVVRNANPVTALSWAGLFLHFGCCLEPSLSGQCIALPYHNTSYKRHLLLDYGSELATLLIVEGLLLDDLRAKGHVLYLEPRAKVDHVNISLLSVWVRHAFLGGRLFGALRAQKKQWTVWRRFVYTAGSPLIPLVRFYRTLRRIRQTGRSAPLPRLLMAIMTGLLPHALGEATGYAFGTGRAAEQYSYFEMRRRLQVAKSEREILWADEPS